MDKYVYCNILEMELVGTTQMQGFKEDRVIFQHDNDPNHIENYVVDWLFTQKFHFSWHPLQSSNLNPIEYL